MRYTGDTGAASARAMLAASSGDTRSSASRHRTQSFLAWSTANCFWRPKPSHSFCTKRAPWRCAISAVASLEAESTITISSAKRTLSRHASSVAAALRVMRTAEKETIYPLESRQHSKWLCPTLKILFVKTSSLGDVVHNCPAVSDAARKIPGAQIDWVVEEPFAPIAAMHAAVHRVIAVRLRDWRRRWWRASAWREFGAFRAAAGAARYDAVIDTQSLIKSALVASFAQGPRHGMDRASAREALAARFYHARHPVPRELHAVERNRQLAAAALGYALDVPLDYGLSSIEDEPSVEAP